MLLKKCHQSEQAYTLLLDQLKQMLRHRFGQKSERYIDPNNPQLPLIEGVTEEPLSDIDVPEPGNQELPDNVIDIKAKKQRKKVQQGFASHLPRTEVVIAVKEHDKTCQCGCQKSVINHQRHERLNYIPPVYEIIVELREVVACPKGCRGEMITAENTKHILPKSKVTESVLAHIIVSKLDDRQPYYHLEKQFDQRAGFTYTRQTMARSTIDCAHPLQPLFNLMKDEVIDYDVGALDATTLQVLNEPDRPARRKSYAYCFRGGAPGKAVILYEYNAMEHKRFVDDWFAGFSGTLHCDADPFFNRLFSDADVHASFCNAHARRKFEPIANATKGDGLAKDAMHFYRRIYRVERLAKDEKMTIQQRYALRQRLTKSILKEFKAWLDVNYPTVLPKSPLGKAFNYTLKHWEGLCRFLDDGRLEADNNLTEQEIKPFVIARKNFMFCSSVSGANALCLHFSLIRTAKHHGLDPYRYYVKILKDIPYCESVEDYEALLPWNISLDKVGVIRDAA
ncbi:IS66 family transposase [Oceanicoccus sp.]|uniref:IS66 family transposase n=1 Tax=Oceanicoccus sp. TaxID=2691044 RepID=UPI0026319C6B|nr:IS66 family transposase [Oceanicoccus sp.]